MPRNWWMKVGFVIFLVLLAIAGLVPTAVELVLYPETPESVEENEATDSADGDQATDGEGDGESGEQAEAAPKPPPAPANVMEERDPPLPDWYKWYAENLMSGALTLGLDLQGGLLLRYSVGVDEAIDDKIDKFADDIALRLAEKGIEATADAQFEEDRVVVEFANASESGALTDEFMQDFPVLILAGTSGNEATLELRENYVTETRDFAVKQAVEIIRERIDALGVASPSVRVESGTHIVVELPGLSSRRAAAAEKLISTTAVMTFKLIADGEEAARVFRQMSEKLPEETPIEVVGGRLSANDVHNADGEMITQGKDVLEAYVKTYDDLVPPQRQVVYEKIEPQTGGEDDDETIGTTRWQTRLVRTDLPLITGDNIDDAFPATNPTTNLPYVSLKLDKKGGDTFYEITKEHVGDQLAILMDDTLVSDPVIRTEIPGGNVSIEMGSQNRQQIRADVENLVVALRSGALPAPIRLEFKTLVGPTLGRDSIERGTLALIIGSALIVFFMLIYYKLGGVVANVALLLNVLFILAIMAALGSALTLPGIAGIILTVGMVIFERIREEIRAGETPRKCIQQGYDKAYWTILDANITTGIAALVLMEFGSGPVRGFAITLLVGIICSVFTAVFVTRLIFDWYLGRREVERLLIYYKLGGVVANVALLLNVLFILAIMAALGSALTLPGIAGIILTVGMVSFLVLPFVKSPNWGTSFSGGSSIIVHFEDTVQLDELRTAFGTDPRFKDVTVQNYGSEDSNSFMLKTSHTASIPCDKIEALKGDVPKKLGEQTGRELELAQFPKCDPEEGGLRGDFFVRFEANQEQPEGEEAPAGTDPKSGVSKDALAKVVAEGEIDAVVTYEEANRRFVVKPAGLQAEVTEILVDNFPDRFNPQTGLEQIVTVGPDVGEKFRNDGILSILFALGLILLYIAIRFDVRYAPGAVVALMHDVIITFGLTTLLGLEVTLETVAALLAIVGYSLNDTIVTFDRIRENLTAGTEDPLPQVVNKAINECLSRTLLTSLTTLLAVTVLAFLGTGVIRDFAITLTIGVLIGTYSSIFVASPIMLMMDKWVEKRKERTKARRDLESEATPEVEPAP